MEKEIINEFFHDIREFKKKVLEQTNNTFKISFIKYIKDENTGKNIDTKRFTLKKSFIGKNLDKVIFNNKIYFKNRGKHENIYISLDDTNKKTNLLWLDDIKLENFTEKQLKYITLIETSPNNYQGYIIVDKELTKDELKKVKLYFCNKYGTDRGSIDFTHLMRLPFFFSYKHTEPFYVNVRQYQQKILQIKPLLNKIKINEKPKKYIHTDNRIQYNNININESELKEIYNKYLKEMEEIYLKRRDYNVIDYRFIHYLYYFLNLDIKNINWSNILFNLNKRKKGHIEDYIERTITKVIEETEYENPCEDTLWKLFTPYIKIPK